MIVLVVRYIVQSGREEQAKAYIRKMEENTRREPGCRLYFGHQSSEKQNVFCFYEQYDDEAALQAHRAAPYFAECITNGLLKIMEPNGRRAEVYSPIS